MTDNYAATPGAGLVFRAMNKGSLLYPVLLLYNDLDEMDSGCTATIVDTTPVLVIPSPGWGHKFYIVDVLVTNSDASVGTWVNITDGLGGTHLWSGYAAPGGGGFSCRLACPVPASAATAIYAECETNSAEVRVSISGFRMPV